MNKENHSLTLKDEITFFRKKLDSLLQDQRSTSEEILALSQELDVLIVQYYRDKKKRNEPKGL